MEELRSSEHSAQNPGGRSVTSILVGNLSGGFQSAQWRRYSGLMREPGGGRFPQGRLISQLAVPRYTAMAGLPTSHAALGANGEAHASCWPGPCGTVRRSTGLSQWFKGEIQLNPGPPVTTQTGARHLRTTSTLGIAMRITRFFAQPQKGAIRDPLRTAGCGPTGSPRLQCPRKTGELAAVSCSVSHLSG